MSKPRDRRSSADRCTATTSNGFLYAYSKALGCVKIGTGYSGTLEGHVYARNDTFPSFTSLQHKNSNSNNKNEEKKEKKKDATFEKIPIMITHNNYTMPDVVPLEDEVESDGEPMPDLDGRSETDDSDDQMPDLDGRPNFQIKNENSTFGTKHSKRTKQHAQQHASGHLFALNDGSLWFHGENTFDLGEMESTGCLAYSVDSNTMQINSDGK